MTSRMQGLRRLAAPQEAPLADIARVIASPACDGYTSSRRRRPGQERGARIVITWACSVAVLVVHSGRIRQCPNGAPARLLEASSTCLSSRQGLNQSAGRPRPLYASCLNHSPPAGALRVDLSCRAPVRLQSAQRYLSPPPPSCSEHCCQQSDPGPMRRSNWGSGQKALLFA